MNSTRDKVTGILEQVFNGDMSVKEAADLVTELTNPDERVYLISHTNRLFPLSRMYIHVTAHSVDHALEKFWSSRSSDDFEIKQITPL